MKRHIRLLLSGTSSFTRYRLQWWLHDIVNLPREAIYAL